MKTRQVQSSNYLLITNHRKFMQEKKNVRNHSYVTRICLGKHMHTGFSGQKFTLWRTKTLRNQKYWTFFCQQQRQTVGILDASLLGGLCKQIGKYVNGMATNWGKGEQIKCNLTNTSFYSLMPIFFKNPRQSKLSGALDYDVPRSLICFGTLNPIKPFFFG